jgi:hypothetical protein
MKSKKNLRKHTRKVKKKFNKQKKYRKNYSRKNHTRKINKKYSKKKISLIGGTQSLKRAKTVGMLAQGQGQGCRELIKTSQKTLLSMYSNPTLSRDLLTTYPTFKKLSKLTHEMNHIIETLNPFDYIMCPATSIIKFEKHMTEYDPRVIIWSGHTGNNLFAFEAQNGRFESYDKNKFFEKIEMLTNIELVIILACESLDILPDDGHNIYKKCSFITWSTVAEDTAVSTFLFGIIDNLKKQIESDKLDILQIFLSGCSSYLKNGYNFGNPMDYIGKHKHEHQSNGNRLSFDRTCTGCVPPEQGNVCLTMSQKLSSLPNNIINGSDLTMEQIETELGAQIETELGAQTLLEFSSYYKYDQEETSLGLQAQYERELQVQKEIETAANILTDM